MAKQQAYGGISIIDVSDVGKLSVWLGSSHPLNVIYDPNTTPSYSPNWETKNLVLTPFVQLDAEMMSLNSNDLSFSWQRQIGSGEPTALVTGEKESGGVLTVSKNMLSDADLITYICTVTYRDPDAKEIEVKAKAQLTFALIKNAKKLSKCDITGETDFRYNDEGKIISSPTINLTANLENTTIKQWQYKKTDGSFETYPNSSASTTLVVKETDNVFVNKTAIIKVLTNTENLSDIHQISKIYDGDAGSDALSIRLGNFSDNVNCDTDGTVSENKEITIPFKCELGLKSTKGTAVVATPLPSGITVKSNTPATTSSEGCIILSVAKGATLFSGLSGEITITITSNGLSNTFKFSINKIIQAKSGENAVLLEVYVTGDSTINNGNNNVILRTILHDGMDTATTGVTYQWSKYIDGSYQDINGCTNDYLTVTPPMVDSTASFRCRAVYKTRTYQAFYTVMDKTDPISVECFSSLGDKLVNGSGVGGVYAMIFQNGQQIDEIKSTDFLTEEPSDGTIGYFYKVNTTSKSVTLMKYSTSDKRWVEATGDDLPSGTYEWYRRDKNGESLDTVKPYKTGKAIYLDNSVVNKKISFVCKYTAYTEEDTHVYILTDEVQRPVVDESDNSISTIVYE